MIVRLRVVAGRSERKCGGDAADVVDVESPFAAREVVDDARWDAEEGESLCRGRVSACSDRSGSFSSRGVGRCGNGCAGSGRGGEKRELEYERWRYERTS